MWYSIEGLRDSPDTWPARVADQLGPLQAWRRSGNGWRRQGCRPAIRCAGTASHPR